MINISKYLTALGVVGFAAIVVFLKGDKSIYLGLMLLCISLNVFTQAFDLYTKKQNKSQVFTSLLVGVVTLITSILIILNIL